jgi:hypothetical protein
MGAAFSGNYNTQIASNNIVQTFSGSCDITCQNVMQGISSNIIQSNIGGSVEITQTCAVNGQCAFNVNQNALADTMFKTNLASSSTGGILSWFTFSDSVNQSYQNINQSINQQISQKCKMDSINQMNNVQMYVVGSNIGGDVIIGQSGDTKGNCVMNAVMDATSLASGTADECAAAGKKGKKSCKGGGKSLGAMLIYGAGAIVLFVVIMMIYRYFSKDLPPCKPDTPQGTPCKPVPVGPAKPKVAATTTVAAEPQYELVNEPSYVAEPSYEYVQVGPTEEGLAMTPAQEAVEFDPGYLDALGDESP